MCSILIDAEALSRAHFGQGIGPIVLDDVNCNSRETTLLQCHHPPLFEHNCQHSEDASVRCNDDQRLMMINSTVVNTATGIVSIIWELTNDTVDKPSFFNIACFNERYSTTLVENNETFITQLQLGGPFSPADSYNCCVSALYNTLQPATTATKLCTSIEVPSLLTTAPSVHVIQTSTTMSEQSHFVTTSIIGGVLGCIITVLLILLGILLVCLLVQSKRKKSNKYSADLSR